MSETDLKLSMVVPFYNEKECAEPFIREIVEVMQDLPEVKHEIIAVDDGSKDGTRAILRKLRDEIPELRLLFLGKNFGQTAALQAGFDHAQGELVLPMDGDGQNDPHDIPKFLEAMTPEVDVVSGWRKDRSERDVKRRWPSRMANKIINRMTKCHLNDFGCTMKLYRRSYLSDVHLYGELHRFIPVFVQQEGGRVTEIVVNHRSRIGGTSNYGLERIFKVLMDLFVIFFLIKMRDKPIYLFGGIGLVQVFLGILFELAAIALKIFGDTDFILTPLPNMGMFLVVLGVTSFLIGLLADMSMRTYYESQDKKPYRIDEQERDM